MGFKRTCFGAEYGFDTQRQLALVERIILCYYFWCGIRGARKTNPFSLYTLNPHEGGITCATQEYIKKNAVFEVVCQMAH